jgi:hypothetical protein
VSDRGSGVITSVTAPNRNSASGYDFVTEDGNADLGPVADVAFDANFKPTSAANLKTLTTLPEGFPATYFDGTARESANATAGAVKAD